MGNYQYYLFDLDGTLTDSGEGIMNSIRHALHKFGITEYEETTLRKFIGPPLAECFQKYFDLSPEEARKGIDYYRSRFWNILSWRSILPVLPEHLWTRPECIKMM